ncbi:hypothetical protein [Carnobacterium maltaromaticum]|uniref:hypothetical protein n=1 Tax=Carnobacterium maltaromaticum TaxID=2751 RepID=UPI00026C8F3A|nr:hypothetical protein [Carnobacterium maltaromaticum]
MKITKSSTIIMFSLMSISLGCIKEAVANEKNDENNYMKNEVEVINSSAKLKDIPVENSNNNSEKIPELANVDKEKEDNDTFIFDSSEVEKLALKLREELKKWEELRELREWQDEEFGDYEGEDEEQDQKSIGVIYENVTFKYPSGDESSEFKVSEEPMIPHDVKKDSGLNKNKEELKNEGNTQELEDSDAIILKRSKVEDLALKLSKELKKWEELREWQNEEFGDYKGDNEEQNQKQNQKDIDVIYENISSNYSAGDDYIYENSSLKVPDELMIPLKEKKESELNKVVEKLKGEGNTKEREEFNVEKKILSEDFADHIYEEIDFKVQEGSIDKGELQKEIKPNVAKKEDSQKRDQLEFENALPNLILSKDVSINGKPNDYSEPESKYKTIKDDEKQYQPLNEKKEDELFKTVLELLNYNYFLENKKMNTEIKASEKSVLSTLENKAYQEQDGVKAVIEKLDLIEKNIENRLISPIGNTNVVHPEHLSSQDEQFIEIQQELVILKNELSKSIEDNKSNLNKLNDLFYILERIEKKLNKANLFGSAPNYTTSQKGRDLAKSDNKKFAIEPVELLLSMCTLLYIYKLKKDF